MSFPSDQNSHKFDPNASGENSAGGKGSFPESTAKPLSFEQEVMRLAAVACRLGVWYYDADSGEVFGDDNWAEIFGYDPEGFVCTLEKYQDRIHPDDRDWVVEDRNRAFAAGEDVKHVLRLLMPDGTVKWIAGAGSMVHSTEPGKRGRLVGVVIDITEHKKNEERARVLNERLQLAIESGEVGIWEGDMVNDLCLFNAQMHKIYGIKPGGKGFRANAEPDTYSGTFGEWAACVHPEDITGFIHQFENSMTSDGLVQYEHRIIRPEGEIRHLRSTARIIKNEKGIPVRGIGTAIDITASKEAEEQLRNAKVKAENAEKAKGEFLASMSHEIRTPMNTVLGMTRLALQTELSPKQQNYLQKIDYSARTLTTLINDILDFSKIEAGKFELDKTPFAIESVLESVANVVSIRAEEKGLEIIYSVSPQVPDVIVGDPMRLGQVLINLVSNAVKFTEKGEIVVSIDIDKQVPDNGMLNLRFAVRDTGIGLSDNDLKVIFQPFSQGDGQITRKYGGTGLGLTICKRIIEMMGGRIWAEGTPGIGSKFSFTVIAEAEKTDTIVKHRANSDRVFGKRVLVVDDNLSAREILSDMIGRFGMDKEVAESGEVAIEMLREASDKHHPFDLVLMDWKMPGMDGIEAASHIKSQPQLEKIPSILMVTAFGREEVLAAAKKIGLDGVLIKPVTDSVMFDTVLHVLTSSSDSTSIHQNFSRTSEAKEREIQLVKIRAKTKDKKVLVVDDNPLNREVVTDFLLDVGMQVDTAVNGLDALNHLRDHEYDVVLMDVHMPEMDGLAAVREIRKRRRWKDLPIIALTAQAQVGDKAASLEAGMTAHLTKPIDDDLLYATLISVLQDKKDSSNSFSTVNLLDPDAELPDLTPEVDLQVAMSYLGKNKTRVAKIIKNFVKDFEHCVRDVNRAFEIGDTEFVGRIAHTVKSAATYIGAHDLSVSALALEKSMTGGDSQAQRRWLIAFSSNLTAVLKKLEPVVVNIYSVEAGTDKAMIMAGSLEQDSNHEHGRDRDSRQSDDMDSSVGGSGTSSRGEDALGASRKGGSGMDRNDEQDIVGPSGGTGGNFADLLPGSVYSTDEFGRSEDLPAILIVDDDSTNRLVLADLLSADHYRVLVAADGQSALETVRNNDSIALILLDVSMPDMDGYEVLQRLQAQEGGENLSVIFITGHTARHEEEKGLLLGAVDYLTKPIVPAIVRARVRNHLNLIQQRKMLERLAEQDGLTGIGNRRRCDEALALACRIATRSGEPLNVAMIDVDYFKQYNDRYGHGAGDIVLRQIAKVVAGFARRPYDVAARYGGEEFVLVLPGQVDMEQVMEKLRKDVLALGIEHYESAVSDVVSVSIGAVTINLGDGFDPVEILNKADDLLYQAKRNGRNRVVTNRKL